MNNYRIATNKVVAMWLVLLSLLAFVVVSCSNGGSPSNHATGDTGTLAIRLRHDSNCLKRFDLDVRNLHADQPYLNRLVANFYADAGDHQPGDLLLTRDEAVQPHQETVLFGEIPAPQDYYISVDIYYSDSAEPYTTANFLATVLPGKTTVATSIKATQVGIKVVAESGKLSLGTSTCCDAYAVFNDGSSQLYNYAVNWVVSNPKICSLSVVDGRALVSALSVGTAQVQASDGTFSAFTEITVTGKKLSFLKLEPGEGGTIRVGDTSKFKAIALYTDDTEEDVTAAATWTMSDHAVVRMTAPGAFEGIAAGDCDITASWGGQDTYSVHIIVEATGDELVVTPALQRVIVGSASEFRAVYGTQDVTDIATWSLEGDCAQSLGAGVYSGVKIGNCTVVATYDGKTARANLSVEAGPVPTPTPDVFSIAPVEQTVVVGNTGYFDAYLNDMQITHDAVWSVSDERCAQVTGDGQVKGLQPGTCDVIATYQGAETKAKLTIDNPLPPETLRINPTERIIKEGETFAFEAYLDDALVTTDADWTVDSDCAQVVGKGQIKGNKAGICTVTASYNGNTATANLTINAKKLTIDPEATTIWDDETATFQALLEGQDVTNDADWSVTGNCAQVVGKGQIKAVQAGTCDVKAVYNERTVVAKLTVQAKTLTINPTAITIKEGGTAVFEAYLNDEKVTATASWAATEGYTEVVAPGQFKGIKQGNCTVTVTFAGKTATATMTIEPPPAPMVLRVDPTQLTVEVNATCKFEAFLDEAKVTDNAEWTLDSDCAEMIANGQYKGVKAGTGTVTVKYQGQEATATLTVNAPPPPKVLKIEPAEKSIYLDSIGLFKAYMDDEEVTDLAVWSVDSDTAQVYAAGQIKGLKLGTSHISVSYEGKEATATLNILDYVEIDPSLCDSPVNTISYPVGGCCPFTAMLHSTKEDVTEQVAWSVNSACAQVLSPGKIKTVSVGDCEVRATLNGQTTTIVLKVTTPSREFQPTEKTIAIGDTFVFRTDEAPAVFSVTNENAKVVDSRMSATGWEVQVEGLQAGECELCLMTAAQSGVVTVDAIAKISIVVHRVVLTNVYGINIPQADYSLTYNSSEGTDLKANGSATLTLTAGKNECEMAVDLRGTGIAITSVTLSNPANGIPFEWLDYNTPQQVTTGTLTLDVAQNEFAGGSDTEANPFLVANPRQLDNVRNRCGGSAHYYAQTKDIDFAGSCGITIEHTDNLAEVEITTVDDTARFYNGGRGWRSVGDYWDDLSFVGSYDGQEHFIDGLVVYKPDDAPYLFSSGQGLFGDASVCKLTGVTLESQCRVYGHETVGGLVGTVSGVTSPLAISDCHMKGYVIGEHCVGGLVGCCNGEGTIDNCTADCVVIGIKCTGDPGIGSVGGLLGHVESTEATPLSVSNCQVHGRVEKANGLYVGGFVGSCLYGEFTNCQVANALTFSNVEGIGGFAGAFTYIDGDVKSGDAKFDRVDVDTYMAGNGEYNRWGGVVGLWFTWHEPFDVDVMKEAMRGHVTVSDATASCIPQDEKTGKYCGSPKIDSLD